MRRRNGYRGNGGTTYDPSANYASKPSPKPNHGPQGNGYDGYIAPPPYTYDPAIEAQRREAQRGLEDTEDRVQSSRHFVRSDLHTALTKQRTEARRSRFDIGDKRRQGEQKLSYGEEDTKRSAGRQMEDFKSRLADIARLFSEQGHRQAEGANAAGVLDAGTMAASAVARGRKQTLAEAPIHTAEGRVAEDLKTALTRSGTARGEIGEESDRSLARLGQNVRSERKQAKRETGRKLFELHRELQIARREGRTKDIDLLAQEIWEARENHPGAFAQWAKENPGVAEDVANGLPPNNGSQGGGSNRGGRPKGGSTSKGGGTNAPPPNRRRGR